MKQLWNTLFLRKFSTRDALHHIHKGRRSRCINIKKRGKATRALPHGSTSTIKEAKRWNVCTWSGDIIWFDHQQNERNDTMKRLQKEWWSDLGGLFWIFCLVQNTLYGYKEHALLQLPRLWVLRLLEGALPETEHVEVLSNEFQVTLGVINMHMDTYTRKDQTLRTSVFALFSKYVYCTCKIMTWVKPYIVVLNVWKCANVYSLLRCVIRWLQCRQP